MKKFLFTALFLISLAGFSQQDIYPVYKGCDSSSETTLESCFNQNLTKDVLEAFVVPEKVTSDNYTGTINVIFLVNREGSFEILYIRSAYKELEDEVKRVFSELPKAQPATYNGRPVEMRFGLPIQIPLNTQNVPQAVKKQQNYQEINSVEDQTETVSEIKTIEEASASVQSLFPEHNSELNIPFTHSFYDNIIYHYEQNENTHTGFKPFIYSEATNYIDLDAQKTSLLKDKTSWAGKKFWNEHFFKVQTKDYWFTINPIFDLQLGKDNSENVDFTYNNTRAFQIQGGLGKHFNFSSSFYESQGRFPDYVTSYIRENRPLGASGTVPGRGKGKGLDEGGFDYPIAEAYLSYSPSKFFNFQFGHGKNFIGDGYRSLMLSDVASPYPYLKISTTFWNIKYTNLWMFMDDVRPSVALNNVSPRKFVAAHYLSWNVNKKLNIGLFEAAITSNENKTGFDVNFFNPIIFYRAIEFTRGSEGGNALLGFSTKYKWTDDFSTYTQFVLDELTVSRFFDGTGYWANKFGIQLGANYHNAFKIENLSLQGELNLVRPYTFSHFNPILNYGHFNQPIGHLWGSNFWEFVGIARYKKDRWSGSIKLNIGKKGLDTDGLNYGGDIYISNDDRVADTGIDFLQGNKTNIFIADLNLGYLVNPSTNTKFFAGLTYRNFDPMTEISSTSQNSTLWFTVGLKADLFNWYFDF
jgi:hypothetical protein